MQFEVKFSGSDAPAVKFTEQKQNFTVGMKGVSEVSVSVADHQLLENRDAADAHPISSITGLEAAIAGIPIEATYEQIDDAIEALKNSTKEG